jgi:hypothetical protein
MLMLMLMIGTWLAPPSTPTNSLHAWTTCYQVIQFNVCCLWFAWFLLWCHMIWHWCIWHILYWQLFRKICNTIVKPHERTMLADYLLRLKSNTINCKQTNAEKPRLLFVLSAYFKTYKHKIIRKSSHHITCNVYKAMWKILTRKEILVWNSVYIGMK